MNLNYKRWKKLLFLSLGIAVGTAFCMKWMESDFLVNGQKFTILGLELFYPAEKMVAVFNGMDSHVRTILGYHLAFDFGFMVGIYPCIAALCILATEKTSAKILKSLLIILAVFQLIAWGCDIAENSYLLKWLKNSPFEKDINQQELNNFHLIVGAKWIIALLGIILSLPFVFLRKKLSANS
jgi:hypothetical protein